MLLRRITQHVKDQNWFSPDGSLLFVQATTANHINMYDVDSMKLVKKPYVLRTGEGPASIALSGG